jgi:hypothetical protein
VNEHFHPEFGYFCPAPRFRRDLRVAFVAFASGAALGAIVIVAVSASYRDVHTASTAGVVNTVAAGAEASSDERHGSGNFEPPSFKPQASSNHKGETGRSNPNSLVAATNRFENVQTKAKPCGEFSSNRHCVSEKPRQARPATDNGALIARVPLGRQAPSEGADALGPPAEMAQPTQPSATSQVAHTPIDTSPSPNAENAPRDRPDVTAGSQNKPSIPVVAKTPRKVTGARNLHRNEESQRSVAVTRGGQSAAGELGRTYARSSEFGRTVFWDWSR